MIVHCAFDDKDKATKSLAANGTGWISQERGAKYYKQNFIMICDVGGVGRWHLTSTKLPGLHTTWLFVMPSRGLCRQNGYARMLDFDQTQLWSMWTHTDMSAKLCRNEFMSDHCSGIAMWTRPKLNQMLSLGRKLGYNLPLLQTKCSNQKCGTHYTVKTDAIRLVWKHGGQQ